MSFLVYVCIVFARSPGAAAAIRAPSVVRVVFVDDDEIDRTRVASDPFPSHARAVFSPSPGSTGRPENVTTRAAPNTYSPVGRCRPDDVPRKRRRRRPPAVCLGDDGDRGHVSAGHETPAALVVGRGEGRRRRHRMGHSRRVQLSDRVARLRHALLGRRRRAHRYTTVQVLHVLLL